MKENNGERAIKGFLRAYMAERKLHKAVAYLDKNIQWIGTGAAEHSCTYQETHGLGTLDGRQDSPRYA